VSVLSVGATFGPIQPEFGRLWNLKFNTEEPGNACGSIQLGLDQAVRRGRGGRNHLSNQEDILGLIDCGGSETPSDQQIWDQELRGPDANVHRLYDFELVWSSDFEQVG